MEFFSILDEKKLRVFYPAHLSKLENKQKLNFIGIYMAWRKSGTLLNWQTFNNARIDFVARRDLYPIGKICNPARNPVPESILVICMYLNQLLEILDLPEV